MKDFVRENWKIAAVCAAGALFLSLVTGLIARNPFGVALFRAFLLALFFGGLGIAGRIVVRTYLPDVAGNGDGQAKPEETRGARVDIVVGEDESPASPRPRPAARPTPTHAAGPSPAENVEEETVSELDDVTSQEEAQALGELAEELSQDLPEEAESAGDEGDGEREEASGDEDMQGDERAVNDRAAEARAEDSSSAAGDDGLDSLPDISNLEVAAPETGQRGGRGSSGDERPEDALRGSLSGQDPLTLARAIRTVLKKDEKG